MFFNFLNIRIEKVLDLNENKKTELLEFFTVEQVTFSLNRSQGSPLRLQSLGTEYLELICKPRSWEENSG